MLGHRPLVPDAARFIRPCHEAGFDPTSHSTTSTTPRSSDSCLQVSAWPRSADGRPRASRRRPDRPSERGRADAADRRGDAGRIPTAARPRDGGRPPGRQRTLADTGRVAAASGSTAGSLTAVAREAPSRLGGSGRRGRAPLPALGLVFGGQRALKRFGAVEHVHRPSEVAPACVVIRKRQGELARVLVICS
jgi:hypothetical protein